MGSPVRTVDSGSVAPFEHCRQEPSAEQIREALAAALMSPALRTSRQSQNLLQYLVDQTLEGHDEMLKERVVGANVFGKNADYDTGSDPIVRVRAADLRKRLAQYYSGEGAEAPIKIEIHPGAYHPIFVSDSQRQTVDHDPALSLNRDPLPESGSLPAKIEIPSTAATPVFELPETFPGRKQISPRRHGMLAERMVFAVIVIVLACGCLAMWNHIQSTNRLLYPWRYEPSVAAFWSGFLNGPKNTDIVLSDSSFSLVEDIGGKLFSLDDYLRHDYMGQFNDQTPQMISNLNMIANRNLGSTGEFELTQRILAMDKLNNKLHVYNARDYTPDLIKQDNVILIGSQIANSWDELFEGRMNFIFTFHENKGIVNRAPAVGEQKNYTWNGSVGYCLLAYLPNPEHNGNALLIEGTSSETTQAAGDFLLSEAALSNFQKMLHVTKLPYFEVLLKVAWVNEAPITSTIAAYRTYPSLH